MLTTTATTITSTLPQHSRHIDRGPVLQPDDGRLWVAIGRAVEGCHVPHPGHERWGRRGYERRCHGVTQRKRFLDLRE